MPAATASAEARPVGLRDGGVAAGGRGEEDMQALTGAPALLYRAVARGGSGEKGTDAENRAGACPPLPEIPDWRTCHEIA